MTRLLKNLFQCALGLVVYFLSSTPMYSANPFEYQTGARIIDFGIFYPIPKLDEATGTKRRQMGTGGVRFSYQFYLNDHFGLTIVPNAWFLPVRVNGEKATIVVASIEGGAAFRALPLSYLDPTLYLSGGASAMDIGKLTPLGFGFPVSAEAGLNLWRQTERFLDPNLAFHVFGGARYYFSSISNIEPLVFHFGITFRGSF